MRMIQLIVLVALLLFGGYFIIQQDYFSNDSKHSAEHLQSTLDKQQTKTKQVPSPKQTKGLMEGDLFTWVGKSSSELTEAFDKPDRKDKSAYGYKWWVYTDQEDEYIQFGVKDNRIVTVFATGNGLSIAPLEIGQTYNEIEEMFTFSNEISYREGISFYTFRLNADDMKLQPLIQLEDDLYVQFYFDTFSDELSSVRLLDGETLLQHRFYEMEYRGELEDHPVLSSEEWEKVQNGMEKQILDLTNVIRQRHQQSPLRIDEQASDVAFLHSKDMAENNYFSHYSQNGNGLRDRLEAQEVYYIEAGENIAAQYSDAPAAMEGWLNSKGHREALLKETYTHLGIGVYRQYYTQNFLAKP
ncbi:CAP domain-containing protein [Virgibacillus sp. W0181]|uniref:CAP domain-containing protein n=1 Tax=Virgibacillus sp. W0181 TaxID=3391581 RepID=UPI003F48DA5A